MTELIWDGKYDENGKKTAPLRVSLPFQAVETVNESAQERQMALELFSAERASAGPRGPVGGMGWKDFAAKSCEAR